MTWTGFLFILCSVTLSALGQTLFKTGVTRVTFPDSAGPLNKVASLLFSPWVLAGLSAYAVGTILWLFALRRVDLSLAYPFVAMSFIMVAASGVFLLGEPLTLAKAAGLALIVSGLLLLALGH